MKEDCDNMNNDEDAIRELFDNIEKVCKMKGFEIEIIIPPGQQCSSTETTTTSTTTSTTTTSPTTTKETTTQTTSCVEGGELCDALTMAPFTDVSYSFQHHKYAT